MAKKSNHTLIREWRHPEHRLGVAITSTGLMLRKRRAGGTWNRTHPKEDLALGDIDRILRNQGYEPVHVLASCQRPDTWIPNPRAAHERRLAAQRKRQEHQAQVLADQQRTERTVLPDESVAPDPARVSDYVVAALRSGHAPASPVLRYVYDMARFHGGATGGYLGTAIGADMCLPQDYPYREALDHIADQVARVVYGSDLRAAALWARVL